MFASYALETEGLAALLAAGLILAAGRVLWRARRAPRHRYDVRAYIVSMADYRALRLRRGKSRNANLHLRSAAATAYVRREHAGQTLEDRRRVIAR
jgi:hypothetical protein